ncbi:MAG: DUF2291 family protein [Halomonas sp.]|uniref:DUF2291 family protein n=1 Tax=Halomonas sp. TaxID=1486246 RepID=UPI003F902956
MSVTMNSVPGKTKTRPYIAGVFVVVIVALMALDTKVITISELESEMGFSPQNFAEENFSVIQEYIETNAVEGAMLADEVLQDASEAGETYGVAAGIGHVVPVTFTGSVVEGRSGIYSIEVDGVPSDVVIRVQTGPAINGTTLRDATGDIQFGDFTNQIEFQNVGAALNEEMKRQVLEGFAGQDLTGETLDVVGAFTMINPSNWLITPVRIAIVE